jgi:hypothetical protein
MVHIPFMMPPLGKLPEPGPENTVNGVIPDPGVEATPVAADKPDVPLANKEKPRKRKSRMMGKIMPTLSINRFQGPSPMEVLRRLTKTDNKV